jgi:hypothetical protein
MGLDNSSEFLVAEPDFGLPSINRISRVGFIDVQSLILVSISLPAGSRRMFQRL